MMKVQTVINLAGYKEADRIVEREFRICGIELVPLPDEVTNQTYREVPTKWEGKLGKFIFRRAWYYVVALGDVPIKIARELYEDPCGRTDIRVAGHCGCPPPEAPWVKWRKDNKLAMDSKNWIQMEEMGDRFSPNWRQEHIRSDNPEAEGFEGFVTSYHIDSEVGLRIFVDTLRRNHGLG